MATHSGQLCDLPPLQPTAPPVSGAYALRWLRERAGLPTSTAGWQLALLTSYPPLVGERRLRQLVWST